MHVSFVSLMYYRCMFLMNLMFCMRFCVSCVVGSYICSYKQYIFNAWFLYVLICICSCVLICSSVIFCSYMFLCSYVQHTYPVSIYKLSFVFSRFAFVYICVRSQALLMPCLVCGQWMGPAGAPPWAFPVVAAWPPLPGGVWGGAWLWSDRHGGWICLCTIVCYRKFMRAEEHHRRAEAGG